MSTKKLKIAGRLTYKPRINEGKVPNDLLKIVRGIVAPLDEKKALLKEMKKGTQWCCLGIKPLDGSDFLDAFCFGALVDKVVKFQAGDVVSIEVNAGRVRERTWTGRDGSPRVTVQHVATKVVRPRKIDQLPVEKEAAA